MYEDNFKVTLISQLHVFAKLNASTFLPEYTCIPYTWIIHEIKVTWTFTNRNIILVQLSTYTVFVYNDSFIA